MSTKIDRTIERLETALMIRPDDRHQRVQLGRAYHQARRYSDAEDAYQKVLRVEPNSSEALYSLGLLRQEQGRQDEALDAFHRAISADSEHIGARRALAEYSAEQRDFHRAMEHYEHLVRLQPREAKVLRASAGVLAELGRHAQAAELRQRALALEPGNWECLAELCDSWAAVSAWQEIIDLGLPLVGVAELPVSVLDHVGEATRRLELVNDAERVFAARLAREVNTRARCGYGWALLQKGRYAAVIEQLDAESSASLEVLSLRGQAYYRLRKWTDAADALGAAVRLEPGDGHLHHWLGLTMLESGKLDEAVTHLHHAVRYLPDSVASWVGLANALLALQQTNSATEPLQRAADLDPNEAQHHVRLGLHHVRLGRNDLAEACFARAVELGPQVGESWLALGETRLALERYAAAETDLVRASQLLPTSSRAAALLGRARLRLGRVKEAAASFEQAIHLDPADRANRLDLAKTAIELGRYADAVKTLESAPRVGANDATDLAAEFDELMGRALFELKRFEEASAVLERRVRAPNPPASAWMFLGLSLEQLSRFGEAEVALDRAVKLDGVQVASLSGLGRCRLELHQAARAIEPLDRFTRLAPSEGVAWRLLGRAHAEVGALAESKVCLERALTLAPNDGETIERYGLTLAALGNREAALQQLHRACAIAPRSLAAWRKIAELRESRAEMPEAVEAWRKVLSITPGDHDALVRLAESCMAVGEFAEALATWRRVLQDNANDVPGLVGAARALAALNRDPESVEVLRQVLRLEPERDAEALALGCCLLRLGQHAEAVGWLRKANAVRPTAEVWAQIAECCERLGNVTEEFDALEACVALDVTRADVWRRLGSVALQLGYRPRAIEAFEAVLRLGKGDSLVQEKLGAALRKTATEAMAEGAWDMALDALKRAEPFQSNDAVLFAEQAQVLCALARTEQAIERLKRALVLDSKNVGYCLELARLIAERGEHTAALTQFQRAVELAPTHFEAWVGVGQSLSALGRVRPAIDAYRRALDVRPSATQERARLGVWLAEEGVFTEATPELERAVAEQPTLTEAALWLARCRVKLGQVERSVAAWRHVLRARPNDVEALLGLATALWASNKPREADFPLEQLGEQIDSGEVLEAPPGFWELRGRVLYALSKHDVAEIALAKAISAAKNQDTTNELTTLRAKSLSTLARFGEALGLVEALLVRLPADTELLQLRAQALAGVGQSDAAVGTLRRILDSRESTHEERRGAARELAGLYERDVASALGRKESALAHRSLAALVPLTRDWGSAAASDEQLAEWYADVARLIEETGEFEQAIGVVDEALGHFPASAPLHARRGRLLERSESWEQAYRAHVESAALAPGLSAWLAEGRVLLRLERFSDAQEALERALTVGNEPGTPASTLAEVHERLVEVGERSGAPELVVRHAEELGRLRVLRVHEWRVLAFALCAVGRHADAVEAFQAVLDEHPEDHDARFAMARALYDGQRGRAAIVPLRQLVKDRPDHAEAWLELARRSNEADEYGAALQAYERAASLLPERADVAREWVDVATSVGEVPGEERALAHACRVLHEPEFEVRWANALEQLGELERAVEVLTGVLDADSVVGPSVRRNLAALELKIGQRLAAKDPERARWILTRAGEHAVSDPSTLLAIVQELADLGASGAAIQLCDAGLEQCPEADDVALFLAGITAKRGEHTRAASAYERVIARKPDQVHLLVAAGKARLLANQPSLAEPWLKRASHLARENVEVATLLEQVTTTLGQTEDTLRAQEALLQNNPKDAALHERYVRLLAEHGHHDRVAAAVRRAEQLLGDVPALLGLGASSLHASGRYAEAVLWAERALVVAPDDAEALRARGASLVELGELERGVESLMRARIVQPGIVLGDVLPLGLVGRGRLRSERGDFDLAATDFQQALAEGADPLTVLPSLAHAARRSQQLARALGAARDLAELQPTAGNICMVGELCLELGQPKEAALAFDAATGLEPSGAAYLGLGTAYFRLGDERAKSALQRAVELQPGPDAYELLVQLHERAGEWTALAEVLDALGKHRALRREEYEALARAQERSGNVEAALRVWTKLVDLHPDHVASRWEQGRLSAQMGDLEVAVSAFETVLELDPHHPQVNGALGRALAKLERTQPALEALERQARRAPDPELLKAIADQQRKLGRDSGSIESLQRIVELEPTHVQAWRELAPLLTSAGRHNDAVSAARRALQLVKDAVSHRVLGETLVHFAEYTASRGERAPCRAALKECIELPDVALSTLGLVLSVGSRAEHDLAQQAAQRLLLTEAADARIHRALARACASRGEWKKAASAFETATNITLRHQHRSSTALPESWPLGSATELLIEWSKALQQDEQLTTAAEAADRALRLGNASNEDRRYAANVHQQAAADQLGRGFADRALPLLQRASELTDQPAEIAFLIALAHRILDQPERAIEAARDCLNFEPLHQGAFRLGKELLEASRSHALLPWYEEHPAIVAREPELAVEHAALLLVKSEHESARRLLRASMEHDKVGQRAALLLADSYRATEEWDEEVTALRSASKRSELSDVHRRRLAQSLEKLGRLDEAAVVLEHVLGGVGDPESLVKLAALQVESKRYEDALRTLERTLGLQPKHLVGLRLKSWVLKQLDRASERIAVMQEIAKHDPQAKELEELADLCLGQKRTHEAERALAQWARLYPRDARAHLRCGLVRAEWGDESEAIEALEQAVRLDPGLEVAKTRAAQLHQQLVQRHLAARRYDEALSQSERWVQNHPKSPDAQHCRAECLQTVGRSLEAVAAWRLVLSEHPGHSPSARMFAAQLAGTGRFDEAELVLAKAVGANRESVELMSTLAQLYITQRKFEQAEIVARRASALAPNDVDVLVLLSQIAANTSRSKEAEDHLRQALRVNPNHSEANYTLGKLYLALGRLDLAQLQLEKLVRINSPRAEKLASRLERSAR